jgi:hypothetical protein
VPVLTAAKLMYAGAAVSTVTLIIALALIPAIKALPDWKPGSCQVPPEADASGPQVPEIHQPADMDVAWHVARGLAAQLAALC